ncbi:hypothetical protein DAPPUDRAFT_120887, partial [Daphnia pulex]
MADLLTNATTSAAGTGASHSGPCTVFVRGTIASGATVTIEVADEDVSASYVKADESIMRESRFAAKGCCALNAYGTYYWYERYGGDDAVKLCKCGAIVGRRCEKCYPQKHDRTTKQRGYDNKHRVASERYRVEHPLCERCVMIGGVEQANVTEHMHHIVKVSDAEQLRMRSDNWLGVCVDCHETLENDVAQGMKVKQWSLANYEQ